MNSRQENEMPEQNSAHELSDEMLVKVVGGLSEYRGDHDHGYGGRGWGRGHGWGRGYGHDHDHGHGGDRWHHRGHHGLLDGLI